MLPGIYYRELNNSHRAVGIRQTPDLLGSDFLIMVDGQYIYNPIYPGTIWSHLGLPLNSIDRIELIRGAAGSLWSTKASNGVINIITKHSIDTQGVEAFISAGNIGQASTGLRYGGQFGTGGSFRLGLETSTIGDSDTGPVKANDASSTGSVHGRIDYSFSDDLALLLQGGLSGHPQSYDVEQGLPGYIQGCAC